MAESRARTGRGGRSLKRDCLLEREIQEKQETLQAHDDLISTAVVSLLPEFVDSRILRLIVGWLISGLVG